MMTKMPVVAADNIIVSKDSRLSRLNELMSITIADTPLMNDQYCTIPNEYSEIHVGDQVRITVGDDSALFTVRWKSAERGIIRLNGQHRLGISPDSPIIDGFIQGPFVVATGNIIDSQARLRSEFIERAYDDGIHDGFICIAPHGGDIDLKTDLQAERVHNALEGTSMWMCKGFSKGGGAFKKWHVTSNDISPNSYPALKRIVHSKRKFTRCVSFHGMAEGGVLIGGQAPLELKLALQKAIKDKIGDDTVNVRLATWQDCCNGLSHRNIVNWLTKEGRGGIQIEQDRKVRVKYWTCVADAVIDVFAPQFCQMGEDDSMLGNFC